MSKSHMDAQTLLLESLDSRWNQYRGHLKSCRRALSEGSVHDLRVATRRLLALAELVGAVAPQPGVRKIRTELKSALNRFDALRDTQVMLDEISRKPAFLPELEPFRQHLEKRKRRLLAKAGKLIAARQPGGLARRLKKVRERLAKQGPDLKERLLQAVDTTYLSAFRRYRRIDPEQPDTLHRARVAFKHLRYTLEVTHPLVRTFPETMFARMQDYQTALGDIQNETVLLRTLTRFEKRRSSRLPRTIRSHCRQSRARLIAAYMKNKGEMLTFWRPKPNQPFPWEAPHEPVRHPARHCRSTRNQA